jgi:hypothetical protein
MNLIFRKYEYAHVSLETYKSFIINYARFLSNHSKSLTF